MRNETAVQRRKHLVKERGHDVAFTWCGWAFTAGHRALVNTPREATCKACLSAHATA